MSLSLPRLLLALGGHGSEPVRSTKPPPELSGQVSSSKKWVVALPAADGPAEINRVPVIESTNASPPAARHALGWKEKFHMVSIHNALGESTRGRVSRKLG